MWHKTLNTLSPNTSSFPFASQAGQICVPWAPSEGHLLFLTSAQVSLSSVFAAFQPAVSLLSSPAWKGQGGKEHLERSLMYESSYMSLKFLLAFSFQSGLVIFALVQ